MINRFIHDPDYIKNAKVPAFDNLGFGALVVWTGLLQIMLDKGQEDDWFGATWIRWAVFFLIISFVYFCWHSLDQTKTPSSTSRSSRIETSSSAPSSSSSSESASTRPSPSCRSSTRNCSATPPSPPDWSSLHAASEPSAVCPSSVILSNKVDPRYLLTFGFFTFGMTTLYFGNVTLDLSPTTLLLPILITGFGLSFVFVPISTAAYGTLRNEQIGNASGLFNLMRNVGGSIGISIASDAADSPRRRPPERDHELRSPDRPAIPELSQHLQRASWADTSAQPTRSTPPRRSSTCNSPVRPRTGPSSTSSAGSRCSASSASRIVWTLHAK